MTVRSLLAAPLLVVALLSSPVARAEEAPPPPRSEGDPDVPNPPPDPAAEPQSGEAPPAEEPPPQTPVDELPPTPPTPDVAPPAPPAPPPAPAAAAASEALAPEIPTLDQRATVGFVASGVAVAAVGVGVVAGLLAQAQYDCVKNVVSCNAGRDDEITGTEIFDARTDFQTKSMVADMGYVTAGVAALVAIASFAAAYVFDDEQSSEGAQ